MSFHRCDLHKSAGLFLCASEAEYLIPEAFIKKRELSPDMRAETSAERESKQSDTRGYSTSDYSIRSWPPRYAPSSFQCCRFRVKDSKDWSRLCKKLCMKKPPSFPACNVNPYKLEIRCRIRAVFHACQTLQNHRLTVSCMECSIKSTEQLFQAAFHFTTDELRANAHARLCASE